MRAALWLLALFGVAVSAALVAGNNQAVVTLFWPPYRVDLSFNLVVLLLAGLFLLLYLASRALTALVSLPLEARRWRAQQKERAMFGSLLDSLAHQLAGRYIRATKSAQNALAQEKSLAQVADEPGYEVGHSAARSNQLRSLAHLLVAESAQSLQNRALRDEHLQLALRSSAHRNALEVRDGVQFRAARWAMDDRDPGAALDWLAQLPQGAARRTLALRMKLRAARQLRHTAQALDTARLLAKHRAFSPEAAQSIVRGLALELLNDAHDPAQLQRAWESLDATEQSMTELAVHAASRLTALHGDPDLARSWLLPSWERMVQPRSDLGDNLRVKLIGVLESGLASLDAAWLGRIEAAQLGQPRDANLQYLASMACLKLQLWGKARQLLTQATHGLQDATLHRNAWRALAVLAEQRDDPAAAAQAYKRAAQL
ncbi:heme biosynthesis HemY N-terminal domain-containing protein [Polaromonas sp.]|jgi:HemY protein|uniref:heme biosynthesis HemY N-terminal domain-containing protein n=1 Tax=Polaromonas sp. TaxID=1869339 RepID=UPI002C8959D3|nr:heme biosynthesis HemY N-terminal domain-containing protein [Polaromonas sp.]HQS30461.1 heme biosynthesis HemY N-terminal domain-containing protein [Polaromonas sp.]HQS89740.1 heme biosynthesis HemY N-terminal domain-containing protein [Polaromonas sp.]